MLLIALSDRARTVCMNYCHEALKIAFANSCPASMLLLESSKFQHPTKATEPHSVLARHLEFQPRASSILEYDFYTNHFDFQDT